MKNSILISIFISVCFSTLAQRQSPIWSAYSLVNYIKSDKQIHTDRFENIYTLNADSKVKKFNSKTGALIVEFILTGDAIIQEPEINVDSAGNVVVVGFQNTTNNGTDIVIAKYDSSGSRLWYDTFNGSSNGNDKPAGLDVDQLGNVFITGTFNLNTINPDVITRKYASSGVLVWSTTFDGLTSLSDIARDIAVNEFGEVFIVGKTLDYLSYEPFSTSYPDSSYKSFFIKYDVSGVQVWNKKTITRILGTYVGPGLSGNFYRNDDVAYNVKVANGSVFVTSDFYIGSTNQQYTWIGLYSNEYESNISKYSYSGSNIGNLTFSSSSCGSSSFDKEKIEGILIDGSNHIYLKRRCNNNRLVEKYSPNNSLVFSKSYSKNSDDIEFSLAKNQFYVVVAKVTYQAWIPSMFVNKYDSSGLSVSNFSNFSGGNWFVHDIHVDSSDDVYITAEHNQLLKYCGRFPTVQTISDTSICFGDSVQLTSTSDATLYSWNNKSSLSEDSILSPFAIPEKSTRYILTTQYESGCKSRDTVVIEVNSNVLSYTLCNGSGVSVLGKNYSSSGTFYDTIINPLGCDSIYIINIETGRDSTYFVSEQLCNGDSLLFNGNYIKTSGNYLDTLTSISGCDSIMNLSVTMNPSYIFQDTVFICQGDSAFIFGNWEKASTNIIDSHQSTSGCDSIYETTLVVYPTYKSSQVVAACNSYTWSYNNTSYSNSGFYYDTLSTQNGCDSVFSLSLTINEEPRDSIYIITCSNYQWQRTGLVYFQTGFYSDTITNVASCDSIITLELNILPTDSTFVTDTACYSYDLNSGQTVYSSGIYFDTLQNYLGCDSLVTLDLTVNQIYSSVTNVTACDNYFWSATGLNYYSSGLYEDSLMTVNGCDSIVSLNLTIQLSSSDTTIVSTCQSYVWARNGNTYFNSGVYYDLQTNANGCDSIGVLNLTINQTTSSVFTVNSCGSYIWPQTGLRYSNSGNFADTISNAFGCDSIVKLNLTVDSINPNVTQNGFELTCDQIGSTYQWFECSSGYSQIVGATARKYLVTQNGNYAVGVMLNNCMDTSTCINVLGVGAIETTLESSFNFYPNPATSILTVEYSRFNSEGTLCLISLSGKVVLRKELNQLKSEIDISGFAKGVYFLRIGERVEKVILQ